MKILGIILPLEDFVKQMVEDTSVRKQDHIGRATRFVDSGFPTLLILGPTLLILGPPLSILGPFLLILEPILLILVVKMGVAILKKTDTIQTVDSGFE